MASAWMGPYVASKHALVGATRSIAMDLKISKSPLQLTLVSPGFLKTEMVENAGRSFPQWAQLALSTPQKMVKQMLRGIEKNQTEITPTLNGKAMALGQRIYPSLTASSSKALLYDKLSDYFLRKPIK